MTTEHLWMGVGFLGQAMFSARMLLQWIASERRKRSVVPRAFWYCSMMGGITLFAYAIYKSDAVFIVGQGAGIVVYARNIYLIHQNQEPVPMA
jgi:lipid-A-disaccharide synthase-like uncharacterized protein